MARASTRKTSRRPVARGPELREALIEHAQAILDEEGLAALNLRHLASRIGITQPALYRHFASKDALLDELVARGHLALAARAKEALAGIEDPYEALATFGRTYVRHAATNPGWFRLTFGRAHVDRTERFEARVDPSLEPRAPVLRALACVVPVDDPSFGPTFRALWALAHGLAGLVVERVFRLVSDDDARMAAADRVIDELIVNLRARWGPPRRFDELPPGIEREAARALVPR